jgi:hypothetical protein
VSGDIQKAFLQVRVRENERDALRFYWRSEEDSQLETLRFTSVIWVGPPPPPFLPQSSISTHGKKGVLISFAELRKSLYVDDLLTGGQTIPQAEDRKERTVEIFEDASFKLHKWNSNVSELEVNG